MITAILHIRKTTTQQTHDKGVNKTKYTQYVTNTNGHTNETKPITNTDNIHNNNKETLNNTTNTTDKTKHKKTQ